MKATAYYVKLTPEMVAEINDPESGGWASPAGRAYMEAKVGPFNADAMEAVAILNVDSAEQVWMTLQNHKAHWSANDNYDVLVQVLSETKRSMDVGDVVVWEDGRMERVAGMGFEAV